MVLFPHCKINLGLNIVRKRPDGFHDLETVFYPVPWYDALEIIPAADGLFAFNVSGLTIPGKENSNLCIRAFRLLQADHPLPEVKMHLHKVIPMGAGLGGGSSDGAFTLRLLNHLFNLGLSGDQLRGYARNLGSDCAFFISDTALFAHERGDQFEQVTIDLHGMTLLLVFPGIHVATADAYAAVLPAPPKTPLKQLVHLPVDQWKDSITNDFEMAVFKKFPVIGVIKQKLYDTGAVYASMSGSGSAVYGLYPGTPAIGDAFTGFHTEILSL